MCRMCAHARSRPCRCQRINANRIFSVCCSSYFVDYCFHDIPTNFILHFARLRNDRARCNYTGARHLCERFINCVPIGTYIYMYASSLVRLVLIFLFQKGKNNRTTLRKSWTKLNFVRIFTPIICEMHIHWYQFLSLVFEYTSIG